MTDFLGYEKEVVDLLPVHPTDGLGEECDDLCNPSRSMTHTGTFY